MRFRLSRRRLPSSDLKRETSGAADFLLPHAHTSDMDKNEVVQADLSTQEAVHIGFMSVQRTIKYVVDRYFVAFGSSFVQFPQIRESVQ